MSSGQQNLASGIGRGRRRGWRLVATLAASETTAPRDAAERTRALSPSRR